MLLVTHDPEEAIELADRVLFLSPAPGRVAAEMSIDIPRGRRRAGGVLSRLKTEAAELGRRALGG